MKTLSTSAHPLSLLKGYVDDTFMVIKSASQYEFLDHINSVDQPIQLMVEDTWVNGSMPFLDTLVMSQLNCTLATIVYIRPSHNDQYLEWDSHHAISAKYSVVSRLISKKHY